jgi:hypothetical protein
MLRKSTLSRTVGALALVIAFFGVADGAQPSPARAAADCHPKGWSGIPDYYDEVKYTDPNRTSGDFRYPATLHGTTVRLMTDTGNASTYVSAILRKGDVLSIDRTNFLVSDLIPDALPLTEGKPGYYFRETYSIEGKGTWDYCETTATHNGAFATPHIDGSNRFVRACLRRNGGLQCTNMWYGDMDGVRRPGHAVPVNPGEPSDDEDPGPPPTPGVSPVSFQANTGFLWSGNPGGGAVDTQLGMLAGTSPAISGGQVAFQANTGFLWTRRAGGGAVDTQLGMLAGTSPAITDGRIAFQANTGFLWTRGPDGTAVDTRLGMLAGTSPAIAGSTGSWKIAFQANDGFLWTRDSNGTTINTWYGMKAGTSPAIAALPNGGYAIAFQADDGFLWIRDSNGTTTNTGLGMKAGTSPAISASGTGHTVAFQANDGFLWTRDSNGTTTNTWLGMRDGTSPAVRGSRIAFQANDGFLWIRDSNGTATNTGYGMSAGTSPAA